MMTYIIGIDFDNTLVSYDDLIYKLALEKRLINPGTTKSKKEIRDTIRQLPDGEIKWQQLQADAYGTRIGEAKLIEGVRIFFELCKQHQVKTCIVSHKTEFARRDTTRTNLRATAMGWMKQNGFFEASGIGLSPNDVYFEATRYEKVGRIRRLGCTHFIDDLEETFLEESFPANTQKFLYVPHKRYSAIPGVKVVTTWQEINDYFFNANS